MATIQVSDRLLGQIEAAVAAGQAASVAALVEEGMDFFLTMAGDDNPELDDAVARGIADIEAGRYVTLSSRAESKAYFAALLEEVRAEQSNG